MNTETLHMYTLSVTRKCGKFPTLTGRVWSWFMSSFSLLLVCSHMIVLLSLLYEVLIPTCTSHTDLSGGLFCVSDVLFQPRCHDCLNAFDYINVTDEKSCYEMLPNCQSTEEVKANVIWFGQSSEPHIKGLNISSSDENKTNIVSNCLAWKHCNMTKIADVDNCPHLFLKMKKLSWDVIFAFIFVSILFASILSQDIEESVVENILPDFSIQSLPADKSMPLSAFVIHITNRIRMYIVLVISGAAGSSIILSDNPSTNDIMINLLSVLFINEDDNMFASLRL